MWQLFWTFRKGEPKKLKYSIAYFSEGSVFNPNFTENQQTYFDYAKEAGWSLVAEFAEMQVFCTDAENPIPFETDEHEKLENIKMAMRKSFVTPTAIVTLVFIMNFITQYFTFLREPIEFISNPNQLYLVLMIVSVIVFDICNLLDYYIWCRRSAASIESGGKCVKNGKLHAILEGVFVAVSMAILCAILLKQSLKMSTFGMVFILVQIPILMAVFWASIKFLKHKKASAKLNKIVSYSLLMLATFGYLIMMGVCIIKFDFLEKRNDYRTVEWQMNAENTYDFRIYSDKIPLTCEDLYGKIEYDYYSYEERTNSTFLLKKQDYLQRGLPAKDQPPQIEYTIISTKFDFIYKFVERSLLEPRQGFKEWSFKKADSEAFNSLATYQEFYNDAPTGNLLMLYKGKIISLKMQDPPTQEQVNIIKLKLA